MQQRVRIVPQPIVSIPRERAHTNHLVSDIEQKNTLVDHQVKLETASVASTATEYDDNSDSSDSEDALLEDRTKPRKRATSLKPINSNDTVDEERFDGDLPNFPKDVKPSYQYLPMYLDVKKNVCVPAAINRWLRDYQREGVRFLYKHYANNSGGILADDMGLGKTVQVIAFLAAIFGKHGNTSSDNRRVRLAREGRNTNRGPKVLIFCPSSVIHNWAKEFDTWGVFDVGIYHAADRSQTIRDLDKGLLEVVISSHETGRDSELEDTSRYKWDCVIVDEVHKLKNPNSEITLDYKALPCRRRLGLTGTAIQNNYQELWCVLDWAAPGAFGGVSQWKNKYSEPLKRGQAFNVKAEDLASAREQAKALGREIAPYFLRRTKQLIADQLPSKQDKIVFCPLAPLQERAYINYLDSPDISWTATKHDPCDCGSEEAKINCCQPEPPSGETDQRAILLVATGVVKKLVDHAALIFPNHKDSEEKQKADLELVKLAFPNDWKTKQWNLASVANKDYCGKWRVLEKLLPTWEEEDCKVLIFSHSVRLIDILEELLTTTGYSFSRLDGSTPSKDRMRLVDEFNKSTTKFIFLISTKAGGVGLNITSANIVVLFDQDWNPSHDLQAQDRAFRFGQRRDVLVYRMVAKGTIDEIIYNRQVYKQQQMNIGYDASKERRLFDGVEGDKDNKGELFGAKNMLTYKPYDAMTKKLVERVNLAEVNFTIANTGLKEVEEEPEESQSQRRKPRKSRSPSYGSASNPKHERDDDLSQFVELIADPAKLEEEIKRSRDTKRLNDAVNKYLVGSGIEMSAHENMIGSSKIEEKISRTSKERAKSTRLGKAFASAGVSFEDLARGRNAAQPRVLIGEEAEGLAQQHLDVTKVDLDAMARYFEFENASRFAEHFIKLEHHEQSDLKERYLDQQEVEQERIKREMRKKSAEDSGSETDLDD